MEKRPRARDGVPLGWRGGGEAEQSGESWGSRWVSDRGSLSENKSHMHTYRTSVNPSLAAASCAISRCFARIAEVRTPQYTSHATATV